MKIELSKEDLKFILDIFDDWWTEFARGTITKTQNYVMELYRKFKTYLEDTDENSIGSRTRTDR